MTLTQKHLAARNARIRGLLPERAHLENCPAIDDEHGRIEAYDAWQPEQRGKPVPARFVLVVRCIECGGQKVHEDGTVASLIDRPGTRAA